MSACNCCSRPSQGAWCTECRVTYEGSTETGLAFHCATHEQAVEIIITFEVGEVSP